MKGFSRDELVEIVQTSTCIKDALTKMNYASSGDAYKVFLRNMKKENIDISQMVYQRVKSPKTNTGALTANSTTQRSVIRTLILRENLKAYVCEGVDGIPCGQGPEWKGRKMHLVLDHINGVNNDHRLENLRFLCPNCNATLDTHGGKNQKHKPEDYKICKCCSKQYLGVNEFYCSGSCSAKDRVNRKTYRKVERPPLSQLLQETEEFGFVQTGKKYGVSDNAIRKWIKVYTQYGE